MAQVRFQPRCDVPNPRSVYYTTMSAFSPPKKDHFSMVHKPWIQGDSCWVWESLSYVLFPWLLVIQQILWLFNTCWLTVIHGRTVTLSVVALSCLFSPVKKLLICLAEGKACPTHPHVLQQSEILYLMPAAFIIKHLWGLLVIRFDATYVIRFLKK